MGSHASKKFTDTFVCGALLLLLCACPALSDAQTRANQAAPVWDVVSVKLHRPGDTSSSVSWNDGTYSARNMSMKNLIADATDVKQWLITGLPSTVTSPRWDIDAKCTDEDRKVMEHLTKEQRRAMLMTMLQQTFGFQFHRATKMQPVFEMTVLPDGSKFKPTPAPPMPENGDEPEPDTHFNYGDGAIVATGTSMTNLANNLSYEAERNIIDKTGLTAEHGYTVELHWTPQDRANGNDNGTDNAPLFVEALRDQLGLKLTASKADVPTVVVDAIHLPETN